MRPQSRPPVGDAERYRTLLEINNALVSNLNREPLFAAIAAALRPVVPFDRTAIFLHDPTRDVLRLFYYDVLHADSHHQPLKVRSLVGLVPLFAVKTLEPEAIEALPGFTRRLQWFIDNRPDLREHVQEVTRSDGATRRLLSIVSRDRLPRVLRFVLDEREFLAPHGIRAVSRHHAEHPYVFTLGDAGHRVDYEPAESSSGTTGGARSGSR